ncbi:hypothetical protein BSL78_28992 [Apostichopus japonicus]|uniref:Uncharacterized protein n=1 Tax=Stichopus japonicus TaxID=307972 RepID=A0A2G8JEJ2_STIJA|nr:hypothetical protein BSL78_28992 [Apostichopus japonicus]
MELTLSFLNVGQLLTILHSVAFSLASNVSINIEVSALPDSTSEPVTMVTISPSSTIGELNWRSSSTSTPGMVTSAVTVDNTTSAVSVDNTTSALTVDNTTSAVTVDNSTSVVTVDNATTAVTVDNTTSAVTVDNTTSAVTVDNTTSTVTVDNTKTASYQLLCDMDIQDGGFLQEMELSLALSYSKAKEIEVEKDADVKQLLQNLNPEEDILLRRRRKRRRRASTIDGHTAQIIDLSRNVEIASSSELVFYIMSGGVNIPAVTCATTFSELSVQELTLLLGVVVLTPVNSYNAVPTTASPPADSNLVILLSILIPLVILSSCMCCCCMFCVMCGPKKKENERTMAPDTFRMLEFKQKFPYKPYPPNQTPRDFKEQPSDDDVVLGTEINLGGDFIEVDPTPRVFPDGDSNFNLESFQLPETIPKTNRGLEPSVTEPPVSSSQKSS